MMDFLTLPDKEDGIEEIKPDTDIDIDPDMASTGKAIREVQYFNLAGQQIRYVQGEEFKGQCPMGIIIRKVIFEDGSFASKKIQIKGLK